MELREVNDLARSIFEVRACSHLNIAFFGLPRPLGWCHRSWVCLSADFCKFNSPDLIATLIVHELTHYRAGRGHGQNFQDELERMGGQKIEARDTDPKFLRLYAESQRTAAMDMAILKYECAINTELDRRIDSRNPHGEVDYRSFLHPPQIAGITPAEFGEGGDRFFNACVKWGAYKV